MRKTRLFIFLMVCLIALPALAQTSKVTMTFKNESLPSVFKRLEKATDYKFLFAYEDVGKYTVNGDVKNASIQETMDYVLRDKPLTYTVEGKIVNVQIRFSTPPREQDYGRDGTLPWRLQPEISGGGYFYDLAPHQLDLLQDIFGVITEAGGICANRGGLYEAEDSVSACFRFENGLPGSGSWCFVGHESAREDRISILGEQGTLSFSVFNYEPIRLLTSDGEQRITVANPSYVQLPIIRTVIEDLQGFGLCTATSASGTPVNWVMDRILGKF